MSSSDSDVSLSTYNSKKCASVSDSNTSLSTSSSKKRASTDDILDNMTATGRQKKTRLSDVLSEYRTTGRKAVATLNPFANVLLAFHYGMTLDKGGSTSGSNTVAQKSVPMFMGFHGGIGKPCFLALLMFPTVWDSDIIV
ncbi:hypothetical protein F4604DRAFT_1927302 [Suillus subluteus]|nr:hypothetical protein F4604DRAFT_1927302 [Suillus subluteus]